MIRAFDIALSFLGLVFGCPVMLILALGGLLDTGSPMFRQKRVGRHQKPFILIKFRTMKPETAHVPTHLAEASSVTRYGQFLRRTKLDELPQLWNVLKGDMSLVGPRPCLYDQTELIAERQRRGVFRVRPGITGLAQVSGIDMSQPARLADRDAEMLATLNLANYFGYIFKTMLGKGSGDRVRQ